MTTINQQLQVIRERSLRRGAMLFAIFAVPAALASISRAFYGEWQPVYTLQSLMLAILLVAAALRHRLSTIALGGVIVAVSASVALIGMYTFGAVAPAGHWFVGVAVFFIGMLYGPRGMVIGTAGLLAGMSIVASLHITGHAIPEIETSVFTVAPTSWLIELMCAAVFIAIVLPTTRKFAEAHDRWIWEIELRRRKIAHLAKHDDLTGLPQMRVVRDDLAMACDRYRRTGRGVAVLFIDLDDFKLVNDRYGHEAGDICLKAVAARLRDRLREQDTVARIGGDEFVVILDNVSGEDSAAALAADLITMLGLPIEFGNHRLQIGASIGVALCPDNGDTVPALLRNADQAMYRSKRTGRNGYVFARGIDSEDNLEGQGAAEKVDSATADIDPTGFRPLGIRRELSEKIVDQCILVLSAAIPLTILANIWRIIYNGAEPNLGPVLAALLLAIILFFGRKSIPLRARIAATSFLGLTIALPGLFAIGLAGPAVGWGCAGSIFLVGVFYNRRVCLAVAIIVLVAICLSGLGFTSGMLTHSFNVDQQELHPSKWLVFVMAAMTFSCMVQTAWFQYKRTSSRLIAESTAQIEELAHLATIDELTGLPLRRLAIDRLDMACSRAKRTDSRAALMIVDLDGFKAVNDSFGHDAGDHCLREIARRMTAVLRSNDTAARIGGDEFLVILDSVLGFESAANAARRLIAGITQPIEFGGDRFDLSASIGIAIFPEHGMEPDILRRSADAAMYAAKSAGKNCYRFAEIEVEGITDCHGRAP